MLFAVLLWYVKKMNGNASIWNGNLVFEVLVFTTTPGSLYGASSPSFNLNRRAGGGWLQFVQPLINPLT